MNNELVNNTYLALELTKVYMKAIPKNTIMTQDKISNIYNDFLEDLTNTTELIEKTTNMQQEINVLKSQNEELSQILREEKGEIVLPIINLLNQGKSDMEPYLYKALIDACNIIKKG